MLDPKILDRARRLIQTEFDKRLQILPKEISRIKREMAIKNMLPSRGTLKKIHNICAEEVAVMSKTVLDSIMRAHKAVGSPLTGTLAADIKNEANHFIGKITEEISQKMADGMHSMNKGPVRNDAFNLNDAKAIAIQETEVEVDLYVDSLTSRSEDEMSVNTGSKTIFISHANEDAVLAETIKTQIDNVFDKKVNVFVSSIPGTISPGSDWFDGIVSNLTENNAFIVLVTSYSEKRPFVWFEIGFSWLRRFNKKCEIYAICVPPINPGDLPEPLCRLQAISLADEKQVEAFFNQIINQFGLGNLGTLEFVKIRDELATYPTSMGPKNEIGFRSKEDFLERDDDKGIQDLLSVD